MRTEILILALIVGVCTWAFRFFPTRAKLGDLPQDGWLSRFLNATGPAAIATLFVASVLPMVGQMDQTLLPLFAGSAMVLGVFARSRSVVGATLAGSATYGVVFALLGT